MHTVVMFGFADAQMLDIAGPLEVFPRASRWMLDNGLRETPAYSVRLVADQPGPLRTSNGLSLIAEDWCQASHADTVLVTGGIGWQAVLDDADSCAWLRHQATVAQRIGSICTGALVLARLGLLNGHAATTHWRYCEELARSADDIAVQDNAIFVRSGKLMTSAGVTSGIDMALAMVEDDHGPRVALAVARELVLYLKRTGNQAQFSATLAAQSDYGSPLDGLDLWLQQHLAAPITVADMAGQCHMSPRNFARVFKRQRSCGPAAWLRRMRLDRARELLEHSSQTMGSISRSCGLGSVDHFGRQFRQAFGTTPRQYRENFRCTG